MAVVGADPQTGQRIQELDKQYVLHSWSVQNQLNPLPVAGAEGCYFWDYEGNRYLDFASQLINVSIGHQHPKVVAAIKEQADKLTTIGPSMAHESRSELARLLAEDEVRYVGQIVGAAAHGNCRAVLARYGYAEALGRTGFEQLA